MPNDWHNEIKINIHIIVKPIYYTNQSILNLKIEMCDKNS